MSTPNSTNDPENSPPGGRQPGSQVLIGLCVVVLVLLALMLNNPAKVAEWGYRFLGWRTPKHECIANLKQIDGAVQQWALEHKKVSTDTYSLSDNNLLCYLRGSVLPLCPLGGTYSPAANVSGYPTCSVPGHTL
jgi:hypothetical protein